MVNDAPVVQQENFEQIDLNSVEVKNVREIGSEWMCYQALIQLGLVDCLKRLGFSELDTALSLIHIISRAVHPASEIPYR